MCEARKNCYPRNKTPMAAFAWAIGRLLVDHFSTQLKEPTYIKLRIRHSSFDLLLQLTGRQNESLGAIKNIFVGICRVLRGFHISYSYRLDNHDGNFKFIINYMYWFDQMFSNKDLSRNSLPLQLPFQRRKQNREVN